MDDAKSIDSIELEDANTLLIGLRRTTGISKVCRIDYNTGDILSGFTPVQKNAPEKVAGFIAQPGENKVTLNWKIATDTASFNIYWDTKTGVSKQSPNKIVGATSPYIHNNLSATSTYYYVVTAVNSEGESEISAEVSATPLLPKPASPANLKAVASDSQITLSWDSVIGASSYNIYWSNTASFTNSSNKISNATSPYSHSGLTNNSAHYYRVTALNLTSESELSSETSATPSTPSTGKEIDLGDGIKMQFVEIPAGSFVMGSPENEPYRESDEGPQHSVKISKAFYMGKYEVTQEQFQKIMGYTPSVFNLGSKKRPVEWVSWNVCVEFCNKLSEDQKLKSVYSISGAGINIKVIPDWNANGFRLPTEAEWEYACRAGTTSPFYWGNGNIGDYCWNLGDFQIGTIEVGKKLPNPWGLYDMSGNVWEYCWDWYQNDFYSNSPSEDPHGPSGGTSQVCRGGSYFNFSGSSMWRSAARDCKYMSSQDSDHGFRIVCLR